MTSSSDGGGREDGEHAAAASKAAEGEEDKEEDKEEKTILVLPESNNDDDDDRTKKNDDDDDAQREQQQQIIDPAVAAEIPEDVLKAALGEDSSGGRRRTSRVTKARVIMIDGQPVLRSNNYGLTEGEPSVFSSELGGDDGSRETRPGRTSYVFEQKKPRKPYTRTKPRAPKILTADEEATAVNKKDIQKDIELAISKRAKYLHQQISHLKPFMEEKAVQALEERAEKYEPSDKLLMPVENQPAAITAVLREYQLEGLRWAVRMFDQGCSCILADEMGLGKTLQSISFLACIKEMRGVKGPHLIVCPLSVMSSWMDELAKWCPKLRVVRLHSSDENERQRLRREVVINTEIYDVALTTYEMACNPSFALALTQKVYWRCVILDEGHKVKNEETTAHQILKRIHRQHTILLTGTPVQNNLHELYALLSFLHPDVFTSSEPFDRAFNLNMREHKVDEKLLAKAHYLMRPFVLRRVKGEVEVSLPPKVETKIMCPLSSAQTFWYRRLLMRESGALQSLEAAASENEKKLAGVAGEDAKEKSSSGGGDWRKLNSLLMQLRKCCNHPYLFSPGIQDEGVTLEDIIEASGKLSVLDRILIKLKENGHRVVIFSQFTSMLDILANFLHLRGYQYARLDGSTNRVQRSIDIAAFNRPNSPVFAFLLSTRAGGLGVNLQTADTCVMFDSDWNPQVDMQAMARVHRIGQKKTVHIYRLVTAGTVEERMTQRAEKKLFLEKMVSRGSTAAAEAMEALDKNDLYSMLRFGVDAVFSKDSGDPPTDEELSTLMDRSEEGERKRRDLQTLKEDTQFTATDFVEGKAEETPISTFMMPAKIVESVGDASLVQVKKNTSLKEIAKEFQSNILSGKRNRKTTTMQVDGGHGLGMVTVLKSNDYDLQSGEPSVNAKESGLSQAQLQGGKRSRGQVAGRDYGHAYTCQGCWDGGQIVCCDLCPVSVHPECIGYTMEEIGRTARWSCPHHTCHECGRKSAAVGGLLFRCECCTRAYCEDHLPQGAEIIGKCKRFEALGQIHPAQACFIRCDADCQKFGEEHEEIKKYNAGGDEHGGGVKGSSGWVMGKKVAITDVWIEDRDTELELPLGNGSVKALAYATFTDLVHFLLRTEGPKKNQKKGKKKKPEEVENELINDAIMEEEAEEEEAPEAGEDAVIRGAVAYYTKRNESVDEIARERGLDARDIVAWNKAEYPNISRKSQLLERTKLWMQPAPPPSKTLEKLSEKEQAQRLLEQRKAAEAAAAAGLVKGKNESANAQDANVNPKDPCVFGRPLKLLRQKDIDPAERDKIMAEMFRRVRPHLERNKEMAKVRERENADLAKIEQEKERIRSNERNRRLERRETGAPVSGYDLLRSGLASGVEASINRRGAPLPVVLPHKGRIDEEKVTNIRNAILRTLGERRRKMNAAATTTKKKKEGKNEEEEAYITSTEIKVLMARLYRAHDAATLDHARAMWTHDEFGDALGYNLAIVTLERDGFIESKLHRKWPEILDLCSLRLRKDAQIPDALSGECSIEPVDEDEQTDGDVDDKRSTGEAKKNLVMEKVPVKVQCGGMEGFMRPGARRGEENVMFYKKDRKGNVTSEEQLVTALEFERLGGRGNARKWRQSIRIHSGYPIEELEADELKRGVPIGKWLRDEGGTWRANVVGRPAEIWSDGSQAYKFCEFVGYKADSGEHEIRYEDGTHQWLFICLNKFRFPDGLPVKLPYESIPSARSRSRANANKDASGGGRVGQRGVGGAWAADGINMNARGTLNGEEALESGYRVYYCAADDTIDGVAAAIGVNANELYSWNAPFYEEGDLPQSGPLKEKTRLFQQIPPHQDEVLAGAVAFDTVKHFPIKAAALETETDFPSENEEVYDRGNPGSKPGSKRKSAEGGDDDDEYENNNENNNEREGEQLKQGRQKKNSRIKKRDFVAEATQAAMELEAELDAQCVVRNIAIPFEYKDKSGSLCDGGRSVYMKMSDEKLKNLKEQRDRAVSEQEEAYESAKQEYALAQEMFEAQSKAYVDQQEEIQAEKKAKAEAKKAKITTPTTMDVDEKVKTEGIKKSKRTLIRKPKPPQPPEQPTPIADLDSYEVIPVEEFVDDDPQWLETAKRAGSQIDIKDILRSKGASIGDEAVGKFIEILVPTRGLWRRATVTAFDTFTGEHELTFKYPTPRKNPILFPSPSDDDEDEEKIEENLTQRFFLPLLTVRYLPSIWEPYEGVPEPPLEDGGMVFALPPIPVAVGGMRGILLPQGRRGEELVRYAVLRRDSGDMKCRISEYTCPATEFERLGGKGSAKKWRQSLRLVGKHAVTQETMGKWLKTIGTQTGADSIGRLVEVFWPVHETFFNAVIESFRADTGEHEVLYDDGSRETVQLSMQTVRWGGKQRVPVNPPLPGSNKVVGGGKASKRARTSSNAPPNSGKRATKVIVKQTWIQCDDCSKWRRVPEKSIANLGDDDKWVCKMSADTTYNKCSTKQEMTDEQIAKEFETL